MHVRPNIRTPILLVIFWSLGLGMSPAQELLVDEDFSSPGSWVGSARGAVASLPGQGLQIKKGQDSAKHAASRLFSDDRTLVLSKGQSVVLRAVVVPKIENGEAAGDIRLGIFASLGDERNQFLADGDNPMDCTSEGLLVTVTYQNGATELRLIERNGPGGLISNMVAFHRISTSSVPFDLVEGNSYQLTLKITNESERGSFLEARLVSVDTGEEAVVSAQGPLIQHFDHMAIATYGYVPELVVNSVQVETLP